MQIKIRAHTEIIICARVKVDEFMAPFLHNETLFTIRANTFKLRDFSRNLSEKIWCEFDFILML